MPPPKPLAVCHLVTLLMLSGGCSSEPISEPAPEQVSWPQTTEPATDVTVRVVDAAGYQAALEERLGQVILVDFWATWCAPCKEHFPHTVQLHRDLAATGLAVISVSLDDPESEPEVLSFLREQEAEFENLISQYGAGTESADAFDLRGDVPLYKLYDRQGQLRYQFSGDPEGLENGEALEKIDLRVRELLDQPVAATS